MSCSLPCARDGQDLCQTVVTAVGENWKLVLLPVAVKAICLANFLSSACCVTQLNVSLTCHAVWRTSCVADYTVRQDLVMDTSVYLGCVSIRKSKIGLLNPKESKTDFAFLY